MKYGMALTNTDDPRPQSEANARAIYQDLLDTIGNTLRDNDCAGYVSHFCLPLRVETLDAKMLVETEAELVDIFHSTRQNYLRRGVSELTRDCTLARFVDADTVCGKHETRIMTPDLYIKDSYSALSRLVRHGPVWKVAISMYAGPMPSLPSQVIHSVTRKRQSAADMCED